MIQYNNAMPELPEVQTVVLTLRPKILNRRVARVDLHRNDILRPLGFDFAAHLTARTIREITRRGKRIVITLDDGNRFYIHLGMTGRLTIEPHEQEPVKHTHLTLHFDEFLLRFRDPRRFGGIWWLGSNDQEGDQMGPEPLTLRPQALAKRLSKTTRAIKNALLDQSVIAGLGNIYVDESLFAAGVHPLTPANELSKSQISRLNRAIKSVLRRALRHRGSTLRDYVDAEGGKGAFQKLHNVYDREGEPCRKCRTKIERIVLGGRSTCFCPKCQPM
jgi:formamidopyrimidine-DNA glycosylase